MDLFHRIFRTGLTDRISFSVQTERTKVGPVLKPKSVKKLETFFFETILNAKLGREC
jgi:hypothetical protein